MISRYNEQGKASKCGYFWKNCFPNTYGKYMFSDCGLKIFPLWILDEILSGLVLHVTFFMIVIVHPGRTSYTLFSTVQSIIRVLHTPHFFVQILGKRGVWITYVNTVL